MIYEYIYEKYMYIIHAESMRNLQGPEKKKRKMKTRTVNRWADATAGLGRKGWGGIVRFSDVGI